jgi:PTH1 family peptidyl-tRNA hydrolase
MWLALFAGIVLAAPCLIAALSLKPVGASVGSKPEKRSRNVLIVGLGNIGSDFEGTRHNVGFDFLDHLALIYGASYKDSLKFKTSYASTVAVGKNLGLAKPNLSMNQSGESVGLLVSRLGLTPEDVLVVVDDINSSFGAVRLVEGSSTSRNVETTHNGLRDISIKLKSKNFSRLLIGVGRPRGDTAEWVLSKFRRSEAKDLPDVFHLAAEKLEGWLTQQ